MDAGRLSLREAARDTQATLAMVQKWMAEYGRYRPKRDIVEVVMKSEQERIAALEQALAAAHVKLQVYDELLTQADKKCQLDRATGPLPSPFGPSAPSSRPPGTRTASAASARRPSAPAEHDGCQSLLPERHRRAHQRHPEG